MWIQNKAGYARAPQVPAAALAFMGPATPHHPALGNK